MKKVDIEGLRKLAMDYTLKVNIPSVILLSGDLGTGKTTFTRFFCEALGVKEQINSPSFNLVNRYITQKGSSSETTSGLAMASGPIKKEVSPIHIYHLDLYRLKTIAKPHLEELLNIDQPNFLCLIEWANAFKIDYKKWAQQQGAELLKLELHFTDKRKFRHVKDAD